MSNKASDNVATEEDIKVLKNIERLRRIEFKHCVTDREMKAIEHLLAEREQMLKEKLDNKQDIKDFQNALNEENLRCANYAIENNELKKRIKELEEENKTLKNFTFAIFNEEDITKNYIPKQVVRDKIEELKNQISIDICIENNLEKHYELKYKIDILQELLEGEKII